MNILLIQGANMEWLGRRQPEIYGTTSAEELDDMLQHEAARQDIQLEIRYTNIEGEAISWIYQAVRSGVDGLIMNPAGFLYAGYALRDCLRGTDLPYIEVHISNLDRREMKSVLASEADGVVMGLGLDSYFVGIDAMCRLLRNRTK
jgi:3-dehydroquinate dehydratase-2